MPDDELAAEMYELMIDKILAASYEQYEISNFSKPGFESRHNSKYWRLDPVYGFGVSAHSFDGVHRYANERDTAKFVELIEQTGSAEVSREAIDAASEFIFLGLRLNEGIALDADILEKYDEVIKRLTETALVEPSGNRLKLTRRGMLFSNEVFTEFV